MYELNLNVIKLYAYSYHGLILLDETSYMSYIEHS